MASVFDYDELDLTGMNIDSFTWGAEKIRKSFGGGRVASAIVGDPGGLHKWSLSAGVLPSDTAYGNTINGAARFNYYFDFFKAHTTGSQEHFIIQFRGKKYHAAFVRSDVDFDVFTSDLYAGGVEIEQRTIKGHIYNDDGSLFWPSIDVTGLVGWYPRMAGNANSALTDYSASANNLTAATTRPTRTTNNGINVVRWDGSTSKPFTGSGVTVSHVWIVGCATDASFAATRGLLNGASNQLFTSATSGTKFVDQAYGANFEYKLNGTALADNNATCPMSGVLGVIEGKFPSTLSINTTLCLGNVTSAGTSYWKGDVAHMILVNDASMATSLEDKIRRFIAFECGGITVV